MTIRKKITTLFILLAIGSCNMFSPQKSKQIIIDEDQSYSEKLFRANCISCHSVINTELSEGGFTMVKLNQLSKDSLKYYYKKATKISEHQYIDKRVLDTLLRSK